MLGELLKIASRCDGLRCDMAMLVQPDIFARTWGRQAQPFWPRALQDVRHQEPGFCFLAEVYWDLEWTLQQQGFDYTYDKRLYDRLRAGQAGAVREHLQAGLDYQSRLARFLENHDEARAAATFPPGMHEAAAVITYLTPGLRLFHQGQLRGRSVRISPHLVRAPREPIRQDLALFYDRLLAVLREPAARNGWWQLLRSTPAWNGNGTAGNVLAWAWRDPDGRHLLAAVNFAPDSGQCYVELPFSELDGGQWQLLDLLGTVRYERQGDDLRARGLYLDLQPWQCHVFALRSA